MGDRRGDQEIEAARTSRLFAQVEVREGQSSAQAVPVMATAPGVQASSAGTDQQPGNRTFLEGQPDRATVSSDRIMPRVPLYPSGRDRHRRSIEYENQPRSARSDCRSCHPERL